MTNYETTIWQLNNLRSDLHSQLSEIRRAASISYGSWDSDARNAYQSAIANIERELTANITKLLLELGNGFAFVGRQYHLEIENEDYYIDLLFYNLKVRSYVVIELKTTEFKPEYAGKLNFYLSAVDKYIKNENDNPTFGILLCKDKKRVTAELALKDINKPIGVSEYKILSEIPEFLENTLPSIEDIEKRLKEDSE